MRTAERTEPLWTDLRFPFDSHYNVVADIESPIGGLIELSTTLVSASVQRWPVPIDNR